MLAFVQSYSQSRARLMFVTTLGMDCHGNFGLAKIVVRGAKIPGKFGPPDYYFQKILVRAWNNGPSANTSV